MALYFNHSSHKYIQKIRERTDVLPLTGNVPEIGVEPTRREALAPETSVSTISPLGLEKAGQRY